jgi:sulfate transport system substrate-binding protein
VAGRHADMFPKMILMTIKDFGGWKAVQAKHFADGGMFDQIYGYW